MFTVHSTHAPPLVLFLPCILPCPTKKHTPLPCTAKKHTHPCLIWLPTDDLLGSGDDAAVVNVLSAPHAIPPDEATGAR